MNGQAREVDLNDMVARYRPVVSFKVRKSLGSQTPDWEDVVNEIITQVIEKVRKGEFRGESSIGTFIYTVTSRRIVDFIRQKTKVLKGGPDTGSAYVTLEVEGHLNAALRRRLVFSASLTDLAMPPTAPNSIAVTLIDQCMGGGTGPIYPVGYPGGGGGPLRTDFLAQTYQAGLAVGAPVAVPYYAQPGKNLQDTIEDLCLRYDMCPVMQRAGPAVRRIDVQYPYEANDRTGTVVLTRLRGSLTAYEATVPYTLTTVARSAGAGSGATQVSVWQANNWPVYGVHEDQLTTPAGASGACTQDVQLILRASNPLIAYKVEVRDTANVKWGSDYFWRDGVLIYDDDYGQTIDQTIIAYTYEATNGGRAWSLQVELAERETAMLRYMAGRTGAPFGRSSGGKWKDTRGR